jgi:hypothetical protein
MSVLSSDLHTLSHEAYVYLYPLVTMQISQRQTINLVEGSRPGFGPPNVFHHLRTFPPADFRAVVRPNFDTLYSNAWLDLTNGPLRLHVPDTQDRYYMLPMLDMWTDVFATVGKRTTGTGEGDFIIVGPDYSGDLPAGLPVITAPTPYAWIIGRTQTNGPSDYAAVHAMQDGYTLTPLGKPVAHEVEPDLDTTTEALALVNDMSAMKFFAYAAEALKVIPPHATDFSLLARIAQLGIVPGQPFDASQFSQQEIGEIEAAATAAREAVTAGVRALGKMVNGWTVATDSIGVYGNYYFKRAVVAMGGLGANPPEDAIYPILSADADGEPLKGEQDYILHFDADQLPPVAAFWSVTMYDAEGFQAPNELNRFALGDRDPLTYNADGSLDLYIQHARPEEKRAPNWLPAPLGPLGITMRLYAPKAEALDGRWSPPPVHKA